MKAMVGHCQKVFHMANVHGSSLHQALTNPTQSLLSILCNSLHLRLVDHLHYPMDR
jgi:hypothetical protein